MSPTSISAGDRVRASGHCAPGWGGLIRAEPDAAGKEFDGRFTGLAGLPLAADGSFSTSLAIPVEVTDGPWKVTLSCDRFIDDVLAQIATAYETVTVTGGTAEPLAFSARSNAVLPGHDLNFSGSGCRADGHAFGGVSVSLGPYKPPTPYGGDALTTFQPVNPDGSWKATLPVPFDYPTGQSQLFIHCSNFPPRSGEVTWSRSLITFFPVPLPSTTTTTTTTSTTTTTTTGVSVAEMPAALPAPEPPATLPRTGTNQTALVTLAILSLAVGALATRSPSRSGHEDDDA